MNFKKIHQAAGIGIACVSLALYLVLCPGYAFPNEWSAALLSIQGLDPFRPLSRPVWQLIMTLFSFLPGTGMLLAANVVNAFLGALGVWLAYQVGARIMVQPRRKLAESEHQVHQYTRVVSGLVCAGFLAVSIPYLIVATRAHPLALDSVLLLAVVWLTLLYRDRTHYGYWYGFAAIYGIGLSEFPTFIILAPLFGLWWLWLFWKSKAMRWKPMAGGSLLVAAGASIGIIFCWIYSVSVIAEWREFDGFLMVYKHFVLDQINQLRFGVPKQGWLIVSLTMVVPAVFVFRHDFEVDHDLFTNIGLYFFRLILLVVAVVVLFNLPGSPWHIIGSSVLLVTPYAITALWFGQLIGFFYYSISTPDKSRLRKREAKPFPRRLLIGVTTVMLLAAGVLNGQRVSPREGVPLVELSRDVLNSTQARSFLLSNGTLDTMMYWLAREKNDDIRLINREMAQSSAYMRFLVTWFDDPALESMAVIGFPPFVDLWMSTSTNITDTLAVQDLPDLWSLQGFVWYPRSGVYEGRTISTNRVIANLDELKESVAFVKKYTGWFGEESRPPELLVRQYQAVARYLGTFANNLGYYLAGIQQWELAKESYHAALIYNRNNIIAVQNLGEIAEMEQNADEQIRLRELYAKILLQQEAPMTRRQLASTFGYSRNPVMFMEEGLAFIRIGKSDAGIERMRQVMELDDENAGAEAALAQAYISRGEINKARQIYENLVQHDPSNASAWLGMARCHMMLGNKPEAEKVFLQLEDMGIPDGQLAMERGYLLIRFGAGQEALGLFEAGLNHEPSKGPSAMGLLWTAMQLNDEKSRLKAEEVLRSLGNYYPGQMMLYEIAMNERDLAAARVHIERAGKLQPGNTEALEKLIQLELFEGREQQARNLLDRLLGLDSSNAYGNYLLSGIHENEGRLDLAEAALRRALQQGPSGEVYYGLAWILEKQERYDEALNAIDQALEINNGNPQYLAVKGIILASMEQWSQAEDLIQSAIRIRSDREIPLFELQLAKIYAHTNRRLEANAILSKYEARKDELSQDELWIMDSIK